MSYKIGSFNLCNCNFRSDKDISKSFEMIASIIDKEEFDIIAMQEVLSENVLKEKLTRLLPSGKKNWKYRWIQPIQYCGGAMADRRGEGYAYLWNANRIDLVHSEDEYGGIRIAEPSIWSQYAGRKYQKIKREPYYARFSPSGLPGGSFFELRLINTHILYGNNTGERLDEFQKIVENVYVNIANRRYGNNMPAYTILLGDYNLTTAQLQKNDIVTVEKIFIGENRDEGIKRNIITVQTLPTTVNRVQKEDGSYCSTGYTANDYDHFSYTRELDEKMALVPERVDAVRKYYGNEEEPFTKYRREVSDHVPVALSVNLRKDKK